MILTVNAIHALSCIALAVAALYWNRFHPEEQAPCRQLLPFIIVSGLMGLAILYSYGMEFFMAYYSRNKYEVAITRSAVVGIVVSCVLLVLPLVGLLPSLGNRAWLMIGVGVLSSLPSARVLFSLFKG